MMSLKGYIGFSSNMGEVESGLYLDQLPDISISTADKLTDKTGDNTIEELWAKVEDRAIKKFRTSFINAVNKCHKISKVSICECLIEENYELMGVALWYLMGAEMMFERINSTRLSRYTTIEKGKARELRDVFLETFSEELTVAVNGIDVNDNECSEYIADETNIVSTAYIMP
jgi:hypothetical protein